jgi:hypothetical protein
VRRRVISRIPLGDGPPWFDSRIDSRMETSFIDQDLEDQYQYYYQC